MHPTGSVCPLLAAFTLTIAATAQSKFEDPAPPTVQELPAVTAPQAQAFDELRTFGTASPLSRGAKVQDWPGFLGPRRDGRCRETGLLASWPDGELQPLWTMRRGEGFASPVVLGDRLVFTHRLGNEVVIECLEAATGKRYWQFRYPTDYRAEYFSAHGPCGTPVAADGRVWVHGVEGLLHCLELATGRVVWKRNLLAEFGLEQQFFGVTTSPLLRGDELLINLGVPNGPTVAAFDRATGRLLWGTGTRWGMSCASPVLRPLHGKERLFVLTGGKSRPTVGGLMVIDPDAHTTIGEFPFRSRRYESVNGVCPVVVDSTVVLTSNYSTGTVGVTIDEDGNANQTWKARRLGIEFSAPIVHEGDLYLVDGVRDRSGAIVCLDPITGTERSRTAIDWEEEVELDGKKRTLSCGLGAGSLLHIGDDRFLCLSDNGHLLRLRCTPDGAEVLDRTMLFLAGETWTPLVLSHGLLYVCQNQPAKIGTAPRRLLCYDLRAR